MRAVLPLSLLLVAQITFADRLIEMPTASKVRKNVFRAETWFDRGRTSQMRGYLVGGITDTFELALRTEHLSSEKDKYSFDLAYQVVPSLPDLTPGIAFGVMDGADRTEEGRRFYGVMSFKFAVDGEGLSFIPGELSIGLRYRRSASPMAGISLPLSPYAKALLEHDGLKLNVGIEYKFNRALSLRFLERGQTSTLVLRYGVRF